MKPQTDSWKLWLDKAKDDLLWTKASLKEEILHGTCFAAQQASEKALKAYLLASGAIPLRIHDLSALLEACIEKDRDFEGLVGQAATLSAYYVEARYPDLTEFMTYSKDQATEVLNFASEIVNFVKEKITRT